MTRLQQALRWWRNHDECPIPSRHYHVLENAGLIEPVPDEPQYQQLTKKGKELLEMES